MISIAGAGRKVAADGRLIGDTATDRAVLDQLPHLRNGFDFNPNGKVAKAVENIARIYREGKDDPNAKAQMVFLDMGTPKAAKSQKAPTEAELEANPDLAAPIEESKFNLYEDIRDRLAAEGVPKKEIAFVHDADTDAKKKALFQAVREGQVRVLLGSTGKMGVGTNVQQRLIAMHHLDAPWKPAEVEQRDGRILRQCNLNPNVRIFRYIAQRSFDAFMWQALERKSKFIAQVLSGTKGSRVAEDIDDPLPEAAQLKAAASGDPRIMRHAELTRQVRQLAAQRRAFETTRSRATWEVKAANSRIADVERSAPAARADAARVQDLSGDKFSATLGGETFTDRKAAGQKILDAITRLSPENYWRPQDFRFGEISGFPMSADLQGTWSQDGGHYFTIKPKLQGESGYEIVRFRVPPKAADLSHESARRREFRGISRAPPG